MLEKIWNVNSDCKKYQDEKCKYLSGTNWYYKKQRADSIKEENKKLATQILLKRNDVKDYKKKMESEIKEYLELRNHARKLKPVASEAKLRHSKS